MRALLFRLVSIVSANRAHRRAVEDELARMDERHRMLEERRGHR